MLEHPNTKNELKELILKSLGVSYLSKSCKDQIQTGNHYQSVNLGDIQTSGFRTPRAEFLDQINFAGKKVLDLGSNLGEISRAARYRDAYLVDGFEYDQYFLEIANLINAYNDITRVSFYQRDITDPSIYREHYDIVLAFSVFTYVGSVLEQVAEITDELFVLETHKLDNNLERDYLNPVLQYFPYYRILGESEWGGSFDIQQKRLVIIFAKQRSVLSTAFKESSEMKEISPAGANHLISAQESDLDRVAQYVDVKRTNLQKTFFSHFAFDYADELLVAVDKMHIDLETIVRCHDLRRSLYSGWIYWLLFIKGYLQYAGTKTIDEHNIYYKYLIEHYLPQRHDPGLSNQLVFPEVAIECISRRFQDLNLFRYHVRHNPSELDQVEPVKIIVNSTSQKRTLSVYLSDTDEPLAVSLVDGWHRLFSAKLWGIKKLRCKIVQIDENPDLYRG